MKIQQLQLALFYDAATSIDFDGLSYFVRSAIKNGFGIELVNNQLLGMVPKDAPPDVPRLQLASENNKMRMQSTMQRTDFFIDSINEDTSLEINNFLKFVDILFDVHEKLRKNIIRVGMVAYKTEYDDEPTKTISRKYLNLESIGSLESITDVNVMFNKPFEIDDQQFNCHVFHSAGYNIENQKGVFLRQIDVSSFENLKFYQAYKADTIKQAFSNKVLEY